MLNIHIHGKKTAMVRVYSSLRRLCWLSGMMDVKRAIWQRRTPKLYSATVTVRIFHLKTIYSFFAVLRGYAECLMTSLSLTLSCGCFCFFLLIGLKQQNSNSHGGGILSPQQSVYFLCCTVC